MAQSFVVPEDLVLTIDEEGVTIEHDGDIVLHGRLGGRPIRRVVSRGGSVHVPHAESGAHLEAHGNISVAGSAAASVLRAGGNVRVGGDLTAREIDTAGSLAVGGSLDAPTLRTGANLTVEGAARLQNPDIGARGVFLADVTANVIRAASLEFSGGALTAKALQASKSVSIGEVRLQLDAIVAPEVHLSPTTSGRAAVIESLNDLAPSPVKGGFRLAEYAEMFGNAESFLAERGLSPLSADAVRAPAEPNDARERPRPHREHGGRDGAAAEPAPTPEVRPVADEPVPAGAPVDEEAEPSPVAEPEPEPEPVAEPAAEPAAAPGPDADAGPDRDPETAGPSIPDVPVYAAPVADEEEAAQPKRPSPARPAPEYISAPTSWEPIVESAPVAAPIVVETVPAAPAAEPVDAADPLAAAAEHPMHPQLAQTVQKIVECYAGAVIPPAVERLRALVEARAYAEVRAEITNIWSELLKYHQKKGIRIHHQVTTTFNAVNSLVKKM
jgi:hypothetical protein